MKYLLFVAAAVLFISCEKEENDNTQAQLTSHDWEQKSGHVSKQFYKISFKQDNTCEVVLDYGGVSGYPDPVILDTLRGKYNIDLATRVISFPESMGTLFTGEDMPPAHIFIRSWKIVSLSADKLETVPVENEPLPNVSHFVTGVQPYIFQPIK